MSDAQQECVLAQVGMSFPRIPENPTGRDGPASFIDLDALLCQPPSQFRQRAANSNGACTQP